MNGILAHNKTWLLPLLKAGLAIGIVYWLVSSGKVDFQRFTSFKNPMTWLGGGALFFLTLLCNTLRWSLLLNSQGVELKLFKGIQLSLVGLFFNFVIPGGVGGDVVKASYLFKEHPGRNWDIGLITVFDRIVGVLTLLTITVSLGSVFYSELGSSQLQMFFSGIVAVFFGVVAVGLVLLAVPMERLHDFFNFLGRFQEKVLLLIRLVKTPRAWLAPLLVSFIGQGALISMFPFFCWSTGQDVSLFDCFLVTPAGLVSSVLPLTPAGLGVGQVVFSFLFEQQSGDGAFGILGVSFVQLVQFIMGLSGGMLFLFLKPRKEPING